MGQGAIPATRNDRVRINRNDSAPGFLENKLESSDGSVDIAVSSCGCSLDLTVENGGFVETWTKYTVDFDDAGLSTGTNDVSFSVVTGLVAGTTILSTRKKQSVIFTGGSLTVVDFQIGYNGDYDTASDIRLSVFPYRGQVESPLYGSLTLGNIDVRFVFTGGVDTDLTQGSVDFWIKTAVLA